MARSRGAPQLWVSSTWRVSACRGPRRARSGDQGRARPRALVGQGARLPGRAGSYAQFRSEGGSRTKQTTLDFATALGPYMSLAAEYAYELFHGKCAYTEVPAEMRLHLHRPEYDAYDEGRPSSPTTTGGRRPGTATGTSRPPRWRRSSGTTSRDGDRAPVPRRRSCAAARCRRATWTAACCSTRARTTRSCTWTSRRTDGPALGGQSAPWLDEEARQRGIETIGMLDLNSPGLVGRGARDHEGAQAANKEQPVGAMLAPETPYVGAVRQAVAARLVAGGGDTLTKHHRMVLHELAPRIAVNPAWTGPPGQEGALRPGAIRPAAR